MLLLLDLCSSHSFVDQALVEKLQCPLVDIQTLKVKMASGDFMYCDKMVPNMQWWLQGHTFETDMRVLPLGGYDGILGMDWLEKQGVMNCNWEQKWIEFDHKQQKVRLTGLPLVPSQELHAVTIEHLVKAVKGNDIWAVAELTWHTTGELQTLQVFSPGDLHRLPQVECRIHQEQIPYPHCG